MGALRTALWTAGLAALLLGCGSQAPAPPRPPKPTPAAAKKTPPAVPRPVNAEEPKTAEPEEFAYHREGLRDPFEPFIKIVKKKVQKPKVFVPKTPLQRYAVEELQLVGVVWGGPGKAKALIEDPGGKGYVVGVGTLVGDRGGGIVKIAPGEVLVEERFVDVLGEETVRAVKLALRKPEGEVNQ